MHGVHESMHHLTFSYQHKGEMAVGWRQLAVRE